MGAVSYLGGECGFTCDFKINCTLGSVVGCAGRQRVCSERGMAREKPERTNSKPGGKLADTGNCPLPT